MAPSYSPKETPPRGATSRLLSMKFMNRLGSSKDSITSPSPLASGTPTPRSRKHASDEGDGGDEDQHSSKRRKTAGAPLPGQKSLVSSANTPANMEAAMRAAVDDEERRRQAAIKKRAAELGDEHWEWDELPPEIAAALKKEPPRRVVRVGYAEIDRLTAANDEGDDSDSENYEPVRANPRIMRFNMKAPTSGDTDDSDGSVDAGRDNNGSRKRSQSDVEPSKKKKKDHVKLKHLTSLSSQGGQNKITCHRCGRSGHKAASCPSANPRRSNSRKG